MSEAAHSPDFAPATSGACPDMKTKPFATTQWEYGPTGFGWFGSSGTSFIFTRDCGGTQKHCDTPHRGPRRKLPSSGSKVSRETGVLRGPWMQEYIKLGRRPVLEPANDGRPSSRRPRGRRDHLRCRFREAGSDEDPEERAAHRDPVAEEGPDALAERVDAEHGRAGGCGSAIRHGFPACGERVQGHLGRQETGSRTAESAGREARGKCRGRDGRIPSLGARLHERGEVPDDRERGPLSRRPRGRREVSRAVSDDPGVVDSALDGLARTEVRRRC